MDRKIDAKQLKRERARVYQRVGVVAAIVVAAIIFIGDYMRPDVRFADIKISNWKPETVCGD